MTTLLLTHPDETPAAVRTVAGSSLEHDPRECDPGRPCTTERGADGRRVHRYRSAEELRTADAVVTELDRVGARRAWDPNVNPEDRAAACRANRSPRLAALTNRAVRARSRARWRVIRLAPAARRARPGRASARRVHRPRSSRSRSASSRGDPAGPADTEPEQGERDSTLAIASARRGECARSTAPTPDKKIAPAVKQGRPSENLRGQSRPGVDLSATGHRCARCGGLPAARCDVLYPSGWYPTRLCRLCAGELDGRDMGVVVWIAA